MEAFEADEKESELKSEKKPYAKPRLHSLDIRGTEGGKGVIGPEPSGFSSPS